MSDARALARPFEQLCAFRVVGRHVAREAQAAVDLLPHALEDLDHTLGVLPDVESRYLCDEGLVQRDVTALEQASDLPFRQVHVLAAQGVDSWVDHSLLHREVRPLVGLMAHDDQVVAKNVGLQVVPQDRIRVRYVYVTAPDPRLAFAVEAHEGQGLRIVDDDGVVTADVRVLGEGLVRTNVEVLPLLREAYGRALKGIVERLRDLEEARVSDKHSPSGLNTGVVHERDDREEHLGDTAAVGGRVHVHHMSVEQFRRTPSQAGDHLVRDDAAVVLEPLHRCTSVIRVSCVSASHSEIPVYKRRKRRTRKGAARRPRLSGAPMQVGSQHDLTSDAGTHRAQTLPVLRKWE
jgi:hypothetical protein